MNLMDTQMAGRFCGTRPGLRFLMSEVSLLFLMSEVPLYFQRDKALDHVLPVPESLNDKTPKPDTQVLRHASAASIPYTHEFRLLRFLCRGSACFFQWYSLIAT